MRSIPLLTAGQRDKDSRAIRIRSYLKRAIELLHALSHSADADPKRCRVSDLLTLCGARTVTIVVYFQGHILSAAAQSDHYRSSSGVADDVGETFLHDSKQGPFCLNTYAR